ncbi:MAG: hypothetical protein ABJA74_03775, partial [Lapillicoccus sp.]
MPGPEPRDAREQQRSLYGEPLGDLLTRLMRAFDLTQGRLAETIGLSAPMLSQLMSAQRVKIGNPAVVQRVQALIRLADEVSHLTRDQLEARLAAVRAEQPTLSTLPIRDATPLAGREEVLRVLARSATTEELLA